MDARVVTVLTFLLFCVRGVFAYDPADSTSNLFGPNLVLDTAPTPTADPNVVVVQATIPPAIASTSTSSTTPKDDVPLIIGLIVGISALLVILITLALLVFRKSRRELNAAHLIREKQLEAARGWEEDVNSRRGSVRSLGGTRVMVENFPRLEPTEISRPQTAVAVSTRSVCRGSRAVVVEAGKGMGPLGTREMI